MTFQSYIELMSNAESNISAIRSAVYDDVVFNVAISAIRDVVYSAIYIVVDNATFSSITSGVNRTITKELLLL